MSSPQSSAILLPSGDRESDRREHSRASSASHDATKQFVQRAYEVINRAKTVQSPTVFTPRVLAKRPSHPRSRPVDLQTKMTTAEVLLLCGCAFVLGCLWLSSVCVNWRAQLQRFQSALVIGGSTRLSCHVHTPLHTRTQIKRIGCQNMTCILC